MVASWEDSQNERTLRMTEICVCADECVRACELCVRACELCVRVCAQISACVCVNYVCVCAQMSACVCVLSMERKNKCDRKEADSGGK